MRSVIGIGAICLSLLSQSFVLSFSVAPKIKSHHGKWSQSTSSDVIIEDDNNFLTSDDTIRRLALKNVITIAMTGSLFFNQDALADTGAEVRGTELTPFNGLMFQYRGNDFPGLQADEINEPSISYSEFIDRMKKGEVEFVEFMAPNGDAAYVTFKSSANNKKITPIRIGEGYPIEQPRGYSSPAFAIRAVKNAGVPYKFIVPALATSRK